MDMSDLNNSNDLKQPIKKKKKGFHLNIHIILISLILIIFGIAAVKLIIWNKGETIEIDPNADTSEFDVEALDSIMPLPEQKREGHEYDDEDVILCLGNNPFSDNVEEDGLAGQIADLTGATVYNGAFPNSTLAVKNEYYNEGDEQGVNDAFCLPYVVDAICSGDFNLLESIWAGHRADGTTSRMALDTLKMLDYNSLDTICIFYDYTDYNILRPVEDPNAPLSIVTFTGALRYSIQKLQETYPYVRIIVMSPYYDTAVFEEGTVYDPGTMNMGHGTLVHYLLKEIDVCTETSVSIIDNFYGSIHQDNYQQYVSEYHQLNSDGIAVLAKRFAEAYEMYH